MGTVKVQMYGVECDNCKAKYDGEDDFSYYADEDYILECAENADWHITFDKEKKSYCPACYEFNDDDEVIIKTKRKKPEYGICSRQ